MENLLPLEKIPLTSFRTARLEDLEDVVQLLHHLGYPMSARKVHESLAEVLRDPGIHMELATSTDDRVIGLMTLRLFPVLRLGGLQLSIEEIVVAPEYRSRGVGRRLLSYAVSYARQKQVVRLEVLSSKQRESAKRGFYVKNGFTPVESQVYRLQMD